MNRKSDYKDLDKWRSTCNRQKRRYYRRTQGAYNSRAPWTIKEDEIVLEHSIPDREISKLIGRSQSAIIVRRCNLKKKEKANDNSG